MVADGIELHMAHAVKCAEPVTWIATEFPAEGPLPAYSRW
ncbi:Uncharacterised protein [Mycobacteroides abscessus subsp. abscessus]|nr:Uncharacterised protein [Mycobacteroides abscessus subsp. abscessus]